ncbi:uncharacterized protein LOC110730433 [Chenopodium quinoa]|uniref:uncharacterized protein LOC110730433 n=1 Tax=Chenopodium quinoa TaxID=63459 RepID=UPI000B770562|nr:uncharacterized protein LOC110730433 [Chenopodium quinoa]
MDNELLQKCILFLVLYKLSRLLTPIHRLPLRIGGESGSAYITRLLTVHPSLFKEQLRLDRDMFVRLVQLMIEKTSLSDGRFVKVAEQVGIVLFILARGASQRQAADTFKHSISTISKYFRRVLQALTRLSCDLICPYQGLADIPLEVQENSLYWPFFKDCVGALDGTHISAVVSDGDGQPFRGRKGTKTWNVLASCSFNRLFTFVNVGYQGSAHDITVWRNCLTDPKFEFPHPPLVDSGYPNTLGYLSPIKDKQTRYHMPEFHNGPPPRGMLEHYNYRHSSLRTTIERCFGNVKGQWKILKNMPQMSQTYQLSIILSTFTLNNFIRLYTLGIPISERCANVDPRAEYSIFDEGRKAQMDIVQNQIAEHIWQSVRDIEEEDHHMDVE